MGFVKVKTCINCNDIKVNDGEGMILTRGKRDGKQINYLLRICNVQKSDVHWQHSILDRDL